MGSTFGGVPRMCGALSTGSHVSSLPPTGAVPPLGGHPCSLSVHGGARGRRFSGGWDASSRSPLS